MTNFFSINLRITVLFPNNESQNHFARLTTNAITKQCVKFIFHPRISTFSVCSCASLSFLSLSKSLCLFFMYSFYFLFFFIFFLIDLDCCYLSLNCGADLFSPWFCWVYTVHTTQNTGRHIMCPLHGGLSASIYKKRLKLHAYN